MFIKVTDVFEEAGDHVTSIVDNLFDDDDDNDTAPLLNDVNSTSGTRGRFSSLLDCFSRCRCLCCCLGRNRQQTKISDDVIQDRPPTGSTTDHVTEPETAPLIDQNRGSQRL